MAADEFERLAVLIEANTKSYERAMTRIEGKTNQTMVRASRSVKTLDTQMKATALTATRFMGIFGVTIGFAGAQKLIQDLDSIGKAAKRTGVDVESLQALMLSAKLAGVEESTLERGLQAFNVELGKAMSGTTELGQLLKANNISIRDANGEVRDTKDLFYEVADLVKNTTSSIEAGRVAQLAGSRSFRQMIPLLRQGSAALREQEEAARATGKIIDEDIIQAAERFNDEWAKAWVHFRAIAVTNIVPIGRVLVDLVSQATDFIRMLNAVKNFDLDKALEIFANRFGEPLEVEVKPKLVEPFDLDDETIIPVKEGKPAKEKIDREREAVERLIESHRLELDVLRELDPIQKEMIGHREVLAAAIPEERKELEHLIRTMRDLEEAQALAAERMQFFQQAAFGALDGLIIRGQKATDVLKDLVTQLARAALQSAIFGGGLFGGGGLGSLFPAAKALGGPVTAGRPYMVGERGPELFIPKASGQIVANDNIGGVTVAPVYQIDARGSDISESRFRAILEQNNQQLRSQVVPMIREAQSRRVL